MSAELTYDVRKLLTGSRAIINLDGLCRVQLMPSGRILQELAEPKLAKVYCKAFNRGTSASSIHTERAVILSYEDVFKANSKALKRLAGRKKRRRAGKK